MSPIDFVIIFIILSLDRTILISKHPSQINNKVRFS